MADVADTRSHLDSAAVPIRNPAASRAARGRVRLGTLNNLRWLGIAGQSAALFIVYFVLGYDFGLLECLLLIAAGAVLNIVLTVIYPAAKRLTPREATAYLAFDVLQLAALLYLTGGIENPFSLLFLAPVVVSASSLNLVDTLLLGGLSFVSVSLLANYHRPLPWMPGEEFHLPLLYRAGIWTSLLLGIGFTSIYAWRISREGARMSAALSATQLALAREHRVAALGALATAAAHELGTPLATIAVVARELEHALPKDAPALADDVRLLREQAERCRAILTRLARPEETVTGALERMPLGALLDDIAAPHRGVDVHITIALDGAAPPKVWRAPEIIHGLGNLIENAADFAMSEVRIRATWDAARLCIEVTDDGPGFSAEIVERIGEPYVTSRPSWRSHVDTEPGFGKQEGMGLGFFIAKTLIEQTGGTVTAENHEGGGATVTASWPRGAVDGEKPPSQELWV